jgi:tetrahydromethanopterin S-methyltransferase subunit G
LADTSDEFAIPEHQSLEAVLVKTEDFNTLAKRVKEALPKARFIMCFYQEIGQDFDKVNMIIDGTVEVVDFLQVELALREMHRRHMIQVQEQLKKIEETREKDANRRIV